MSGARRHSRRNAPGGAHFARGGQLAIQPISPLRTRAHPRAEETVSWSMGRDGEQVQFPDIAPEAVDGTQIRPASLTVDLFAETILPPEVVDALPALPDAIYPEGRLVFLTTDGKLYRNVADAWTASVDGADIEANSITAGQIAAGAIGADQLAAEIVLGGLIIAGDDEAAHVELDSDGLRIFDADLALVLNAPTDGEPLYVNAEVEASGLSVSGDAVFQGDGNSLAIGAILTAEASVVTPTQAPTLAQGWDSETLPVNSTYDLSSTRYTRQGLAYDAAGGAGGATKVFWTVSEDAAGEAWLLELLASDRTVNRAVQLTGGIDQFQKVSVVRHKTDVYICSTSGSPGENPKVHRYLASDLSFVAVYDPVTMVSGASDGSTHVIASDGTNPYLIGVDDFGVIKWRKYTDAMATSGSTVSTGVAPDGSGTVPRAAYVGSADFGATRICVLTEFGSVYTFDASGTQQTNETFTVAGPNQSPGPTLGLTYGDALGDGARFWSMGVVNNSTAQTLCKHTTWTWTTASSKYWVAYSWYDDVGTAHETQVGPRASITMGRRKKMTVTAASLPGTGGADEPNKRRVYMVPKSTAPATTELKLQNAFATDSTVERTYDSGGAAPQTSNGFAGLGTAAEIKSATSGWSLKGDGTAVFKAIAHIMSKNSNQSISTGTASFTKIASYDTTTRTNADYFSNTTGVITLLKAGLYRIACQVAFAANGTGQRFLGVGINGSDPLNRNRVSQNANGAGGTHLAFSMMFDAAANDTVQMMVEQSSGGNLNATDGIFHIAYLGT